MSPSKTSKPELHTISRREFLTLTSVAAVAAVVETSGPAGAEAAAAPVAPGTPFQLPDVPSQNPAYMATATDDGGLAIWTRRPGSDFVGFRLNANGRIVWRLCDGNRRPAEIAAEFARQTGRPAGEGAAFLEKLMQLGIIASGAHVVPGEGFPRPPEGGAYRLRIEPGEGETP